VKDEGHEDPVDGSETGTVALMEKTLQSVKQPAGGTVSQDVLAGFALWLLKNGRREETVKKNVEVIRMLIRKGANIYDPEAVKEFINKLNVSEDTKMNYANLYGNFVKFCSGSWEKPRYGKTEKIPFIPTEEELDMLIARCGRKTAAFLQFLKETGVRVGEALMVKWTDVDLERKIVNITPEKRSKGRILPISDRLVEILKGLPRNNERVFPMTRESIESSFMRQRNSLALKLKNPRLKRITLHTFRHWKATMEYHKTKDIVYVKELLGHKNIQNTMIYINIERALFQTPKDEFYCKTASTIDEASKLIEAGFEYVTTFNGIMLFRKRK
ncbi:MAG: site-specific integrase, partial [Candidatus Bathyarchaeia archaeon]